MRSIEAIYFSGAREKNARGEASASMRCGPSSCKHGLLMDGTPSPGHPAFSA